MFSEGTMAKSISRNLSAFSRPQNSLRSLLSGQQDVTDMAPQVQRGTVTSSIKELSSLANVVCRQCAKILQVGLEELREQFESEASAAAKEPQRFARNFLEYACFKALAVANQGTDPPLRDPGFRRLTYDMMVAWETPKASQKPVTKIENETSVGLEAFARLAPAVAVAADSITVHYLFDALNGSSGRLLTYPTYERYLVELDRTIRSIRSNHTATAAAQLGLQKGESVIEVDGNTTTPVLQHVRLSAWPGRLTLTDHAVYFEPSGVMAYDTASKFDLTSDSKQQIKADLTGPLGAKIFDKAVVYSSKARPEPVALEFPELTGNTRRNYWLACMQEILAVHAFTRTHHLEGIARQQALARAVLGIARLKTIWTMTRALPPHPTQLLTFVSADSLPSGDKVLKVLASSLQAQAEAVGDTPRDHLQKSAAEPARDGDDRAAGDSFAASRGAANSNSGRLEKMKAAIRMTVTGGDDGGGSPRSLLEDTGIVVGDELVGGETELERALAQARSHNKAVERAKASVELAKFEGIGNNVALLKELAVPFILLWGVFDSLRKWDDPPKTMIFISAVMYLIYSDWIRYAVPVFLLLNAGFILYLRYIKKFGRGNTPMVVVPAPPPSSTVGQLMSLQQAIAFVEYALQDVNIALLKTQALFFSEFTQATDQLLAAHVIAALALLVFPFKLVCVGWFLDTFTNELEFRRESTRKFIRRMKEWWYSIPVVPVKFVQSEAEGEDG
ncbi:hypothetical protein KFL_000130030 [Klebsormidium nitens]|uniref:GRAM domain-containing protein n=1 Tax=Klebsormidium nitens TaxID=105231 RepID=A0A1Y1HN52_KLENI|nr:hypothetical protein KFL_000130030 [Klebsormidium nitens]|eukprot:GAQ78421.1 hypothetical protein KFL_000130030 [Klebsormidium nitens]